jgi:hypothetical protein
MPLTPEQIQAMQAGRETDDLIARYVMKFERTPDDDGWFVTYLGVEIPGLAPHYSTSIAAAFEMETELKRRGLAGRYAKEMMSLVSQIPYAHELSALYTIDAVDKRHVFDLVHASPLDRCKAALLVMVGRQEGR